MRSKGGIVVGMQLLSDRLVSVLITERNLPHETQKTAIAHIYYSITDRRGKMTKQEGPRHWYTTHLDCPLLSTSVFADASWAKLK